MGLFDSIFGPSREEVWREFAIRVAGRYVKGGLLEDDCVRIPYGFWEIVLTESDEHFSEDIDKTRTKIEVLYLGRDDFVFNISDESLPASFGKLLGIQDIETGKKHFDDSFIIQSNSPSKVTQLFDSHEVIILMYKQTNFRLGAFERNGIFIPCETALKKLYINSEKIRDIDQLENLFHLCTMLLDRMVLMGSVFEISPETKL